MENGVSTLFTNPTPEQKKAVDATRLKDLKANNYLFQAIERGILETILQPNTAKDIWESLKQKYSGSTKVKHAQLPALRREFEILTMKESKFVNEYFSRTFSIANKN